MHRRFCPECGSGILDEADALPGVVMVNAGTLDDRSWVKPLSEIYCKSAQPWVHLGRTSSPPAKAAGHDHDLMQGVPVLTHDRRSNLEP